MPRSALLRYSVGGSSCFVGSTGERVRRESPLRCRLVNGVRQPRRTEPKIPVSGVAAGSRVVRPHDPSSCNAADNSGIPKGARPFGPPEGPAGGILTSTSCRFRPVGRPSFLLAQKKEGKNCAVGGEPPLSARGSMTRSLLRVKRLWLTNTTRTCVTGQKSLYASIGIAAVLGWREWMLCWEYW
jgi:hypothetical protein